MRKIGDLFADLGFNPDSSTDAQKAFIKHLIKAAEQNQPSNAPAVVQKNSTPTTQVSAQIKTQTKVEPQQLEFNFGESDSPKKVS